MKSNSEVAEIIVQIENLTKTYKGSDIPAVNDLSLAISKNQIYGLLGPNGAGKTSTINILCGIQSFDSGKVEINGMPIEKKSEEIKRIIGLVPQDIALYPTLTGLENLSHIGNMYGLKGSLLRQSIEENLLLLGLENAKNKLVKNYSGGMKRRLNLIASLLHKPEILILDEPTVGVDVQSRKVIINHLLKLHKEGTSIIYTSHYLEEAEELCTEISIIDYGKIIAQGNPTELINSAKGKTGLEEIFLLLTGNKLRDNG